MLPRRFLFFPVAIIVSLVFFVLYTSVGQIYSQKATKMLSEQLPDSVKFGHTIMPVLSNETTKAELGRASWKLFHTILARFPIAPSEDEREALSSYIFLFARLYPCAECAEHFQKLLKEHPPQTNSRDSASLWGCAVHNEVNKRLNKSIYDCSDVTESYDCGCRDDKI